MFDSLRDSVENVKQNLKSEERIKREIADTMDQIAREEIAPRAEQNAPRDLHTEPGDSRSPGRLKQSIRANPGHWRSAPNGDRYAVEVGSNLSYARAIEMGRSGEQITTTNAPYLHFYWEDAPKGYVKKYGTKWVKTDAVQWPGFDEEHYLLDAVNDPVVQQKITDEVADDFETAIRFG